MSQSTRSDVGLFVLVDKDLRCIWSDRNIIVATMGFALLAVIVASFAFRQIGYGEAELRAVTPGILTLAYLFAGVIGLNHAFLQEYENQALRGVLLTGVDPAQVYLSKVISNVIFIGGVNFLSLGAHAIFFGANLNAVLPELFLMTFMFTIGFVGLGTLLSGISTVLKEREVLLPLVLFPLILPLVAGIVFLMRSILTSGQIPFGDFWFILVAVFDAMAFVVSWCLFEYVVQE